MKALGEDSGDPPRRLVQTWRMYMDEGLRAEGFTRLTYELDEFDGVTRLTLTHDCTGAPNRRRSASSISSSAAAVSGASVAGLIPITASPAP